MAWSAQDRHECLQMFLVQVRAQMGQTSHIPVALWPPGTLEALNISSTLRKVIARSEPVSGYEMTAHMASSCFHLLHQPAPTGRFSYLEI